MSRPYFSVRLYFLYSLDFEESQAVVLKKVSRLKPTNNGIFGILMVAFISLKYIYSVTELCNVRKYYYEIVFQKKYIHILR